MPLLKKNQSIFLWQSLIQMPKCLLCQQNSPGQHELPLLLIWCSSWTSDQTPSGREKMVQIKRSVGPEYVSIVAFIFLHRSPHCQILTFKINSTLDMRNLFRTFHSLLCPPSPPPTTSITADDFAIFFTDKTRIISSQFSPPHIQDLQQTTSTAQTPIFSFCPLTDAEVSKLLLSSHPTTCPLDPIPSHLLQAISPALLPALIHIINTSLLTGIFPTAFKQARVTPLLKKPTLNTSLLENYRPVSLLPFIAKTLKQVFFNQVSLFISQNNKLDAKQSGFRSGHSTETVLLSVTEALRIAKVDSKSSVLILLDPSAAFDTVNNHILLSTLSSLDITGIPLRWFESYLTGRSFRVAWGGEVSKAHQLVTGVPQGSVLGPLLFSINLWLIYRIS